jgi:Uncharacterised nucleotidyltransferase
MRLGKKANSYQLFECTNKKAGAMTVLGAVCSPNPSAARALAIEELSSFVSWDTIADVAIKEKIGPLLYYHLKEYEIIYPQEVRRVLAGATSKQRYITIAQSEAMDLIAELLINKGIPFKLLKGAALAHTVYRDTSHRPMEDLDILVPEELCDEAQTALNQLGFVAPKRIIRNRHDKYSHQLPTAYKIFKEIIVSVEIHRTPLSFLMGSDFDSSSKKEPYVEINYNGKAIEGLSAAQSIILSYTNLEKLNEKARMIQVADIVGLFDMYGDVLTGHDLGVYSSRIYNSLPAINMFSPITNLSVDHAQAIGDKNKCSQRIGEFYSGWPCSRIHDTGSTSDILSLIKETLYPPEWWIRVAYGVPLDKSTAISRIFLHSHNIYKQSKRRLFLGRSHGGGFLGKSL